jgi:o-succinylbenzoate synthase
MMMMTTPTTPTATSPAREAGLRIQRAWVTPYQIALQPPVTTAAGRFELRVGWWLSLLDPQGRRALGDAAPWPGFGHAAQLRPTHAKRASLKPWTHGDPRLAPWTDELARCAQALQQGFLDGVDDPASLAARVQALTHLPEPRHAVEQAALWLLAQQRGVTLAHLLGGQARARVPVHALVADPAQALQAVAQGHDALKVKVGAASLDEDDARLAAIRAAVGPQVALRADANAAWTRPQAHAALQRLAPHRLAWLEQPLDADDLEGLAWLRSLRLAPIAADEAVKDAESLAKLLALGAADVVVLKPMFVGGLWAARALALQAQAAGVGVMVTHALESSVGRWGALHLAASLPDPLLACGLTGSSLTPVHGALVVPDALDAPWSLGLEGVTP